MSGPRQRLGATRVPPPRDPVPRRGEPPRRGRRVLDPAAVALISLISPVLTGTFGALCWIDGDSAVVRHFWAHGLGTMLLICCAISLWAAFRAAWRDT